MYKIVKCGIEELEDVINEYDRIGFDLIETHDNKDSFTLVFKRIKAPTELQEDLELEVDKEYDASFSWVSVFILGFLVIYFIVIFGFGG